MVPVRDVFEWLTVPFVYDSVTATVSATYAGKDLTIKVGENIAIINGELTTLQAPAEIYEGKLYVPARVITETFSGTIHLDGRNLHITVGE